MNFELENEVRIIYPYFNCRIHINMWYVEKVYENKTEKGKM